MTTPLPTTAIVFGRRMPLGNKGQLVDLLTDLHCVAGVVAPLATDHDVVVLGGKIDELAFSLIAPLEAQDCKVWTLGLR